MTALYIQVLSIGVLWTSFHCAGMCGPLISGLTLAPGDHALGPRAAILTRARRVLAYQAGRAVTYALMGGVAGWLGSSVEGWIGEWTRVAAWIMAIIVFALGVSRFPNVERQLLSKLPSGDSTGRQLGRIIRYVSRLGPPGSSVRMVLTGSAMGLLPCMLMFWVLAVSASSASAVHGALLMTMLVVLTTPVLLAAACTTGLAARSRLGPWVIAVAMMASGVWLALIGAAANGWIAHLHLPFRVFGEMYTIMLW